MYWIIGLTIIGLIITVVFCFSITKEEHTKQIAAANAAEVEKFYNGEAS